MNARAAVCALLVGAWIVGTGSATKAQRFTSGAIGVRVDVLVRNGREIVGGLAAGDFELRDEGVRQTVSHVELEQLPLNLILVFDTSLSVAGARMRALLHAGDALLEGLREPDRVALLTFSGRVRLLAPLTSSRPPIRAAFAGLSAEGSTSLFDAAFAGLALREADPGRTLLLLFSDGADTASWLTDRKVIEAAKRSDAVVYAVGIAEQSPLSESIFTSRGGVYRGRVIERSETVKTAGRFLERLTKETGGRVLFATSDADLRGAFAETLAEFRNRYVLSYTPTGVSATGWHRLEVTLKGKKGRVTARRGYFAE